MMMKRFAFIFLTCMVAAFARADKATPELMTFTQSDGTEITVRLFGDEHFSWYATTDGVLLVRDGGNDFFVAEVDDDGELHPTSTRAHDDGQRTVEERRMMKAQRRDIFFSEKADLRRAARRRVPIGKPTNPPYFPHTGSPTAVVILVNFADTTFVVDDPVKTFDQYLNGDEQQDFGHGENRNYASVRQYFEDMSFGQFSPKFKIVGPVTVSKGMAYYGANQGLTKDVKFREMLTEACTQVIKGELLDFADPTYDSDGDGNIDLVYFIYAGYGESNGAGNNTIWPKSSTTTIKIDDYKPTPETPDCGKTIRRFGLNNELNGRWGHSAFMDENKRPYKHIMGIGLFCHEFSHTMGLPDFYPYNLSARVDNQEMEYWSLMDGGEYLDYGYCPAAYTAWEREAMGWFEVETLGENQHIDIEPIDAGGKAYRMVNPADQKEYMMLENIQQKGWSKEALGHGLLLYHVKWTASSVNMGDHPNDTKDYPCMAVVPADGLIGSGYLVGTQQPWGTGGAYKRDENGNYVYDENGKRIILDHVVSKADYEGQHEGDPFPGKENVGGLEWNLGLPNYVWYTAAKAEDAANEEYVAAKKYPVYQTLRKITEDVNTGIVSFDYVSDITTGIESLPSFPPRGDAANGEIFPRGGLEGASVYDLQGRKVIDNLQLKPGIYIWNGKKFVVK